MREHLQHPNRLRGGLIALLLFCLLAAYITWRVMTRDEDREVRAGIVQLQCAVAGEPQAFEEARRHFRRALARRPFDHFPAFLLHLTDLLADPRQVTEVPVPSPFERAVALWSANRPHEAQLMLMQRPPGSMQPQEELLLRALLNPPPFSGIRESIRAQLRRHLHQIEH